MGKDEDGNRIDENKDGHGDPPSFVFDSFAPDDEIFREIGDTSLSAITNAVRRSTRTVLNRLRSIDSDAKFVRRVAEAYKLPLATNARAGTWYVDPQEAAGETYFKSTDGHTGEWGFSRRRLNLGLIGIAGRDGGRGFPDSLTKTIPIWVSVINAALFPLEDLTLITAPQAVSPSEHSQIRGLLPRFLSSFLSLSLDLTELRKQLPKPLIAMWVNPTSPLPPKPLDIKEFTPLILVTASRLVNTDHTEGEYIQGAGDDHEAWASGCGLTPGLFWKHRDTLLGAQTEEELLGVIEVLRRENAELESIGAPSQPLKRIAPTSLIFIGTAASIQGAKEFEIVVDCRMDSRWGSPPPRTKHFPVPTSKLGAKTLRAKLRELIDSLKDDLLQQGSRVVFICETGDDVAPVVALAVLCQFFRDDGQLELQTDINKEMVKRRLAWIVAARGSANPARSLLNAVNSVLMSKI